MFLIITFEEDWSKSSKIIKFVSSELRPVDVNKIFQYRSSEV
ncbi:MAG: hypothetical protein K0R00_2860 [Herbinix sp.]|jgi:hypothetical protein|nr:hypothetical protein [Herbinix sp.]